MATLCRTHHNPYGPPCRMRRGCGAERPSLRAALPHALRPPVQVVMRWAMEQQRGMRQRIDALAAVLPAGGTAVQKASAAGLHDLAEASQQMRALASTLNTLREALRDQPLEHGALEDVDTAADAAEADATRGILLEWLLDVPSSLASFKAPHKGTTADGLFQHLKLAVSGAPQAVSLHLFARVPPPGRPQAAAEPLLLCLLHAGAGAAAHAVQVESLLLSTAARRGMSAVGAHGVHACGLAHGIRTARRGA